MGKFILNVIVNKTVTLFIMKARIVSGREMANSWLTASGVVVLLTNAL